MKRNENATCGNCPYWAVGRTPGAGECRMQSPRILNGDKIWLRTYAEEWCGQHPDFWEAEAAKVSITYADGHTECVAATADCKPPALDDVLAAYRRAVEMGGRYDGRVCDACAHPHTVVCGRCLVGWQLQFQPKEDAQ